MSLAPTSPAHRPLTSTKTMDPPRSPTHPPHDHSSPPPQYKWFQASVIDPALTAIHSKLYDNNVGLAASSSSRKTLGRARKTPVQLPAHKEHMASRLFPHPRPSTMEIIVGGSRFLPDRKSRQYHVPTTLMYKHTSVSILTPTFDSSSSSSDNINEGENQEKHLSSSPLTFNKVLPSTFQNFLDYMHSNIYSVNSHNSDYHPIQSHMRAYLLGIQVGATAFANAALRALCKSLKPREQAAYNAGTHIVNRRVSCDGIAAAPFHAADVAFVCESEEVVEQPDGAGKARLKSIMFDAVAAWLTTPEVFGFEKDGGYPTLVIDRWDPSPPSSASPFTSINAFSSNPASNPSTNQTQFENQIADGDAPHSSNSTESEDITVERHPGLPYARLPSPAHRRERTIWTRLYATHADFRERLQSSFKVPEKFRGELFRDEEDYVKGVVQWKETIYIATPSQLNFANAAAGEASGRDERGRRRFRLLSRRGRDQGPNAPSSSNGGTVPRDSPGSVSGPTASSASAPPGTRTGMVVPTTSDLNTRLDATEEDQGDEDAEEGWMMAQEA